MARSKVGKVAVYLRVSTIGQSLDSQRSEVQSWLDGQGIDNAVWYTDRCTGNNTDRPGLDQLQRDVFQGRVKMIVCYKLDRLSRKLADGIKILNDWLNQEIRVVATSQQLDFNGAVGQLVASVLFAVSQMETEVRKERQAAGIKVAKSRGTYKGRKPGTVKFDVDRMRELRQTFSISETARVMGCSERTITKYARPVENTNDVP